MSIDNGEVELAVHACVQEIGKDIGLANIRSQLNLRYGVRAQLEASSRRWWNICTLIASNRADELIRE